MTKRETGDKGPAQMEPLRAFFRSRLRLAAVVITLALAMKALVPAGYMIGTQESGPTIEICGSQMLGKIALPLAGVPEGKVQGGAADAHAKAASACPYAALSLASLAGTDALLLAGALLFLLALGFAPVVAAIVPRRPFLTPPLRGPPAFS